VGSPKKDNHYQVYPFFSGTDQGCTDAVYLLPPQFVYGAPTTFSVRLLYTGGSDYQQYQYKNADFELALSLDGDPPPSQGNVLVGITLTGTNMWACAQPARTALQANFVDFLLNVEKQFELQGVLVPGATARIGREIADRIPAPPLEMLFYRYGLSPGLVAGTKPYVDVLPGMRLRVDTQASQFVSPGSKLNGYVGSGRFVFDVVSVPAGGARVTAFDPLLGTIRSPSVSGPATTPVVAGGLVDLQPVSGARPHWRLFYPPSVPPPGLPGDLTIGGNATLVGASTLDDLKAATDKYPQLVTSGQPPSVYAIFLGRAMAVPEIPIRVTAPLQGPPVPTLEYVPLGTTIAQVVERYAPVPLDPAQSVVSVTRISSSAPSGSAAFEFVTDGLLAMPSGMYDVPLLAGDTVSLRF
jgi:hypothetical protein